jgi:tetratricopeptide (TPR) repeat protein
VRIGINSGPVVVGTIGTDLNMTYTAIGDTVNLASRVQGLAAPGAVVMSEATHRLVRGYFVTRDLGQHQVKGKEQDVGICEVLRPSRSRSRLDVYAELGLSPLVGRDRELSTLEECFAQARAGHGTVAFIAGDPGIGKSRLLHELKRRLEGEPLIWREGRCIAYGRDIAYLLIIDVLRDSFGIHEADAEAEIVQKLDDGTRALGDADVATGLPFLKLLLSVDPGDPSVLTMDPQLRKSHTFDALRALALATSAVRPLVLMLEDLHWMDRLSEEVVSYLTEALAGHRILLLLTHRPGYEPPFGTRPYFTSVRLDALTEPESVTLAERMLAAGRLPDTLRQIITSKAEGNPFFVEEIVKSLQETGALRLTGEAYVMAYRVEEIDVPDTVHDVIMARLDRLEEEPKRALQTAAVIGREFGVRLLERTTDLHGRIEAYLRALKAGELIYERSLYPERAYMFKHALTHDVAYNSLLLARRKVLHRLVGQAIEELYADRLAEQYETLAYHYERAELWDKALDCLIASGDKALAAFAPLEAVAFYDRALGVLRMSGRTLDSDRVITFYFSRGQAQFLAGDRSGSAESYLAMLQAAGEAADRVQEGQALFQLSWVAHQAHRLEDALEYAERGRALALEIGDQELLGGTLAMVAYVHSAVGELESSRQRAAEALQVSRKADSPAVLGRALHAHGWIAEWQGDYDGSLVSGDEMLALGRQRQLPTIWASALWAQGLSRCGRGDYDEAMRCLKEGIDLTSRLGTRPLRAKLLNTLGWVYQDLCNWGLAIDYSVQSATEARAVGDPEIIRNAELNLGDCNLALGRLDEAQRYLETVFQESQQQGAWGDEFMKWRYSQRLHVSLGELWLARDNAAMAIEYADQCIEAAEATTSRRNIVKGRRLKGEALLA